MHMDTRKEIDSLKKRMQQQEHIITQLLEIVAATNKELSGLRYQLSVQPDTFLLSSRLSPQ